MDKVRSVCSPWAKPFGRARLQPKRMQGRERSFPGSGGVVRRELVYPVLG
jgi:hypothetical protein